MPGASGRTTCWPSATPTPSSPTGPTRRRQLREIVRKGISDGLLFLSDADARPAGAAHPLANLWDNGDDPVAALRHEMKVRAIGLERFGLDRLPDGCTALRPRSQAVTACTCTTATSSRRP